MWREGRPSLWGTATQQAEFDWDAEIDAQAACVMRAETSLRLAEGIVTTCQQALDAEEARLLELRAARARAQMLSLSAHTAVAYSTTGMI